MPANNNSNNNNNNNNNNRGKSSSSSSSSSSDAIAAWSPTLAACAAVGAGCALATHGKLPDVFGGERHAAKRFASFEEFYPFYLTEHSDPTCRLLHVVGTSLIVAFALLRRPTLIASLALAASVGYIACEATRSTPNGVAEMALMLVVFFAANKATSGALGAEVLFVGYFFAWLGHFVFEKNRPATFIYPSYSLMSDFRMLQQIVTQQLPIWPK